MTTSTRMCALPLIALLATFVGCSDETTAPLSGPLQSFNLWAVPGTPTHGQIYVTAQTVGSGNPHYISGGEIFTATSHPSPTVDGGTLTVSDLPISHSTTLGYYSVASPTFGAISAWGLSGNPSNGTPAVADSFYVPTVIKLLAPTGAGSNLSKASSISVQWNMDANNSTGVVVGVRYDWAIHQFADSAAPVYDYAWYELTPDDGSYTIPSSALDSIPVGGYMVVTVARGASKEIGTPSRRYHAYAYSFAETIFKVTN